MVKIYNSTWRMFHNWCTGRKLDPLSASHKIVLDFLQGGLKKGLRPATLMRQVAALDSVLLAHGGETLARNPPIQRFLKEAESMNPTQIHRFLPWKLNVVLHTLTRKRFKALHQVELKWVRLKAVFLVAITSAQRISKLEALSCHSDLCIFHKDKVVLRLDLSFIPKVSTKFHRSQEIILPSFCPAPQNLQERV